MIIDVMLLAFGEPGEIRRVSIPDPPADWTGLDVAEDVYHWGQNDFQPQQHPSVSAGDVAIIDNEPYIYQAYGCKRLTREEFQQYRNLPRRERHFSDLVRPR